MTKHHKVYISLGSNLDHPQQQVIRARASLAEHPQLSLEKASHWYRSKAVGPGQQDDYINGAVQLSTTISADQLLDLLQEIEHQHNRQRHIRWGPRTLDLDILLFDDQVINTEKLTIPHPHIAQRNFVLQPLLDLDPNLTLPDGRKIADILHIIGTQDLTVCQEKTQ